MIIASTKAPPPPPPRCLCAVAETALFKEPAIVAKPSDATIAFEILKVEGVEVKPADVRSDISISVSVSVTVS